MAGFSNVVMELRRRRIFRAVGMYIVAAWIVVQVASLVFPAFEIAETAIRYIWIGVFLSFPLAMVFAWLYDVTPSGIVRTPPVGDGINPELRLRRVDYLVLSALLGVVAVITYDLGGEIRDMGKTESTSELEAYSIAVLPLENISGDAEQQYFVDGMHEALIAYLSRISALKVISRTSSRRYGNSQKPLGTIGMELGAANIIEGSVYRVGNEVRITVQLIDSLSDELLWSQSYARKLEDILFLQSEVASSIAAEVDVVLTPQEKFFFASPEQVDPEAYEAYLKGRFHWYKFTPQDLQISLEYFQAAVLKDPDYALAYIGYADALATPAHIGLAPASEVFPQAIEQVQKALELDPLLAEAHDLSARFKFVWNHDWAGAERGFQAAIKLKPSHPDAHIVYSQLLAINERWEEALAEARTGLRLDPLNDWPAQALGVRLAWAGRYDEALDELLRLADAQPNWPVIHESLRLVHFYRGNLAESLVAARKYYELSGQAELAQILALYDPETEFADAMNAAASALLKSSAESYVSEVEMARLFAFAGDIEQTLHWLEQAYEKRDSQLVYTAAQPLFSAVWDQPRYMELRQKMNLPPRKGGFGQP
jgi:TolB-like protein